MNVKKKLKKLDKKINKLKLDIVTLYKNNRDEDAINLIKIKKGKLDLLMEEYNKMAKMEIRDGKLQKAVETAKESTPTEQELDEAREVRKVEMEAVDNAEAQAMFRREHQQPRVFVLSPEQMRALRQQELERQEELLRQQELAEERYEQQLAQQQAQQSQQQVPSGYRVKITYFPDKEVSVDVREQDIEEFLGKLNEAINSQTLIVIGGTTINGRYIIKHELL